MAFSLYAPGSTRATGNFIGSSSVNLTVNAGSGSHRLLVVHVILRGNPQEATVTYNGTPLSLAAVDADLVSNPNLTIGQFCLINPASGSNTLTISVPATGATSYEIQASVYSADGAISQDQDNTAKGSTANPSVSVTPGADGALIVAGIVHESATALTTGSGETEIFNNDNGAWVTSTSYAIQTTAAAQVMDWIAGETLPWVAVAASYLEESGGPAIVTGSAVLSGSGGLSAQATNIVLGRAQLAGSGGTTGAALNHALAEASLAGSGQLSGEAVNLVNAVAQLAGSGALSGTAHNLILAQAELSGAGDLYAEALNIVQANAQLAGAGHLSGSPILIIPGAGLLTGAGEISAAGEVLPGTGFVYGAATLTGAGSLSATPFVIVPAQAQLSGSGDLAGAATVAVQAMAQLIGSGALAATGRVISMTVVLPDGRTLVVAVDLRTLFTEPETRTLIVERENRILEA